MTYRQILKRTSRLTDYTSSCFGYESKIYQSRVSTLLDEIVLFKVGYIFSFVSYIYRRAYHLFVFFLCMSMLEEHGKREKYSSGIFMISSAIA